MIETQDLILRAGNAADGPALYRNFWRHDSVFRYLFARAIPDDAAACRKTAAYAEMHRAVPTEFFVCEKPGGEPIGIAGVKPLSPGHWTITDVALGTDYQGRGYGRQILAALVRLAFSQGAEDVAYECFADNEASRRLAKSCGFTFTHTDAAELTKDGRLVTMAHYRIAPKEVHP